MFNGRRWIVRWITIGLVPLTGLTIGQRGFPPLLATEDDRILLQREVPDDPYIPVPRSQATASAAAVVVHGNFVSVQVNVDGDGNNIVGDAANEPSIAVDPNDASRMAIGWRQFDTILSNFRQAGWGYTQNGGSTWTFPGVIEPGIFRSDPVLSSDADGTFYYYSLTVNFLCQLFRSSDGGVSWDAGTFAFGGDKAWMAIDRTDGIGRGNIYAAWSIFAGCCGPQVFNRSTDAGGSFENPVTIQGNPIFGVTTVGPDGEVYVAGTQAPTITSFAVAKSTTIQDRSSGLGFDFSVTVDLGGVIELSEGPNPGGLLGQVWVAVDPSDGPRRGNVYVLCSVDPPGIDPLDVHFIRSEDGGLTWSAPVRVNDDPPGNGAWQWFGTMSVAPTGRIDAIWNDTRADGGGFDSQLYRAYSLDGGITWSANEALSPSFDPHLGWPKQQKLGDYYDMVSDATGANIAYAATFNGEQDVYYLRLEGFDCNANGLVDVEEVAAGTSPDCNANLFPDECDTDCDKNGSPDECDIARGEVADCNQNEIPDACDIATGFSLDNDGDSIPDECQCDPVANLLCSSFGEGVQLSWNNAESYTSIEVFRDSRSIATLLGNTTTYRDPKLAAGSYTYDIESSCGGFTMPASATCPVVHFPTPDFIRGDANGDGSSNGLLDGIFTLEFQFQDGNAPPCREAADADNDGELNGLVDAIFILAHQFQAGPRPAAPYPACGVDPEPETSLGCDAHPGC